MRAARNLCNWSLAGAFAGFWTCFEEVVTIHRPHRPAEGCSLRSAKQDANQEIGAPGRPTRHFAVNGHCSGYPVAANSFRDALLQAKNAER